MSRSSERNSNREATGESFRGIGGFFALELPTASGNLLQHWLPADTVGTVRRHNARSALHARLSALGARRLWLPAYCCAALAEAAPADCSVRFYGQGKNLQADVPQLDRELRSDDAVVLINYFGAPPAARVRRWLASRADVHWIEDRAHSLASGRQAWGDDVLYSPRKLCGVADGGLLFVRRHATNLPMLPTLPAPGQTHDAALLRLAAEQGQHGIDFYSSYQRQEQAMTVTDNDISALSWQQLQTLGWKHMVQRRRQNYQLLQQQLSQYSWLGSARGFVPSHFVLAHPAADRLSSALHEHGIYAQRHWSPLAAPTSFTIAHQLSRQLLSIPCDHRYDADDMTRIVASLRPLL